MQKHTIQAKGVKFEPLGIVQKKLGCSSSSARALCTSETIRCVKIEGAWYVDPASLVKGLREVQKKRSDKEILISKIRNMEKTVSRTKSRGNKWVIGGEIHKRKFL